MKVLQSLSQLVAAGTLDQFAFQFASFLARKDPTASPALILRGAELAAALVRQDTCIDLATPPGGPLGSVLNSEARIGSSTLIGDGSRPSLLTREASLLYLSRYHRYEAAVASGLLDRIVQPTAVSSEALASAIDMLFEDTSDPDWQRIATVCAATRGLAVITGGPGTGKTTTVLKLLAAITLCRPDQPPAVALAAPTGKAAARLSAGIRAGFLGAAEQNPRAVQALAQLPVSATTLHRLLGARPFESGFRYNAANPLPVDVLVIDEFSMVDLAMFAHTLDALPASAQLILLGDPDQLPAVEAGNVLQDIVNLGAPDAADRFSPEAAARIQKISGDTVTTGDSGNLLQDGLIQLRTNYRFGLGDSVASAAKATLKGSATNLVKALKRSTSGSALIQVDCPDYATLANHYASYAAALQAGEDAEALLDVFEASRVLGSRREGEAGVVALNAGIEQALRQNGVLSTADIHYHGRPLLIARNDYNLRLYNGDVGVCVFEDGQLLAAFRQPDGTLMKYLTTHLPPHETCFAMTVHKAQGSEFDEVALVLPETSHNTADFETRELLYTAITRARERIVLYGQIHTIESALSRRTQRNSGLPGRLHKNVTLSVAPNLNASTPAPESAPRGPESQLELF